MLCWKNPLYPPPGVRVKIFPKKTNIFKNLFKQSCVSYNVVSCDDFANGLYLRLCRTQNWTWIVTQMPQGSGIAINMITPSMTHFPLPTKTALLVSKTYTDCYKMLAIDVSVSFPFMGYFLQDLFSFSWKRTTICINYVITYWAITATRGIYSSISS